MNSKPQALRGIILSVTLSEDALQHVARVAVQRSYAPAEIIRNAGAAP